MRTALPSLEGVATWINGEPKMQELRGLPVLVVDDNATNRRILYEILTRWEMKTTCCEDGQSALAALQLPMQMPLRARARDSGTGNDER